MFCKLPINLQQRKAGLVFHDLGDPDINSDVGRVTPLISAFAEMERKRILQRQMRAGEKAVKEAARSRPIS